jgi:hypothetical protein
MHRLYRYLYRTGRIDVDLKVRAAVDRAEVGVVDRYSSRGLGGCRAHVTGAKVPGFTVKTTSPSASTLRHKKPARKAGFLLAACQTMYIRHHVLRRNSQNNQTTIYCAMWG